MAERFRQLYKLQNNLYISGAPIVISAGSLLLDTETGSVVAQFKFHSVSNKIIKAIKISLLAYDILEKDLCGVENYQYLDLHITNGQYFGQNKAIVFPDSITRSFSIKNISVVFADKSCWNWNSSMQIETLPSQQVLYSLLKSKELENQYRLITNEQATYIPVVYNDMWICTCGEANKGDYCTKCTLSKRTTFDSLDITSLRAQAVKRIATENSLKEELDIKRREKMKIKSKYQKIILFVLGLALTIFSGIFIIYGSIPNLISYGLTIRVINLILWTICAFSLGIIILFEQYKAKQGDEIQFKSIKVILTVVGIITFVVFYIMTYIM